MIFAHCNMEAGSIEIAIGHKFVTFYNFSAGCSMRTRRLLNAHPAENLSCEVPQALRSQEERTDSHS